MDLVGRHAFLAGGHKEQRGKPLGQRDLAALQHGADRDGELFAALVALIQASTVRLAFKHGDLLSLGVAAMRANGTIRPNAASSHSRASVSSVKIGFLEVRGHDRHPLLQEY